MTSLVDTLDSKHKVSTADADTSSAVVKPAKGIDVRYGMVPLMKSSRAKPGSFEDRSWDGSSCARTVCPFFRSALSHAAPFFSDVAGRFDAPCIVNPISHQENLQMLEWVAADNCGHCGCLACGDPVEAVCFGLAVCLADCECLETRKCSYLMDVCRSGWLVALGGECQVELFRLNLLV